MIVSLEGLDDDGAGYNFGGQYEEGTDEHKPGSDHPTFSRMLTLQARGRP
jgi:hypothetical protein